MANPTATLDLNWSAFDQARGTKPRKAAAPLTPAQQANAFPVIPLSPAAAAQVAIIQRKAGLPVTGKLDPATVAYVNAHYNTGSGSGGGGGGKGKGKGKGKGSAKSKSGGSSSSASATAAKRKVAQRKAEQKRIAAAVAKATAAYKKQLAAQAAELRRNKIPLPRVNATGTSSATNTGTTTKATRSGKGAVRSVGEYTTAVRLANPVLPYDTDLAARHVAGTPYRFKHGWIPVTNPDKISPGDALRTKDGVVFASTVAPSDGVLVVNTTKGNINYGVRVAKLSELAVPEDNPAGHGKPRAPRKVTGVKSMKTYIKPSEETDNDKGWSEEQSSQYARTLRTTFASKEDAQLEHDSMLFQSKLQNQAMDWAQDDIDGDSYQGWKTEPDKEIQAKQWWYAYQVPTAFAEINNTLRGPDTADRKKIKSIATRVFKSVGITTNQPVRTYRALRGGYNKESDDYLRGMKPGAVFTERGMVSSTTQHSMAEGWLGLDPRQGYNWDGRTNALDTIMQIEIPKGTRMLGGSNQFIEAMLPPDTKFRVKSVSTEVAKDGLNPLGLDPTPPVAFRKVIVEVVN